MSDTEKSPEHPQSTTGDYWKDLTDAQLVERYMLPHALKVEDDGRYVTYKVLLEAARRLLKRETWPEPKGPLREGRP
jgi:hypothetical protein